MSACSRATRTQQASTSCSWPSTIRRGSDGCKCSRQREDATMAAIALIWHGYLLLLLGAAWRRVSVDSSGKAVLDWKNPETQR